jgi:hypothetical protein
MRFDDVPLDVRERQGVAFVAFLKPSLQSQGFDDVNLLRQRDGLLNGLPAVVVDYEARKGWFQGSTIVAIVQASSPDRWARVVPPFDRILADIRVPPELRRAPALLAMPPPRGWTDVSVRMKARSPNTVLAFSSASAGSILISTGRSPHGRLEEIPEHEIRAFQTEVTDGILAGLRREGYNGVDVKAPSRGVFAGLPALAIEWTATKGQQPFRGRQLNTWYRQRHLVVDMVAPTDRWSESAPVFEAILADPKLRAALALPVPGRPAPPAKAPSLTTSTSTLYTNSWAVVIGIDRYQKPGLRLQYAVSDARSVQDALSRLGFPLENIVVLLDEQATKQHIVADDMRGRTDLDDRLFVFFAGHGVTLDLPGGGQMGYLLPADGDPEHLRRVLLGTRRTARRRRSIRTPARS